MILNSTKKLLRTRGNKHYIGALAGNFYAGGEHPPATHAFCVASTDWVIRDMKKATILYPDLPVYITNWATEKCTEADCQYDGMQLAKKFLNLGWKVWWFGTLDCLHQDCSATPEMTHNRLSEKGPNGKTMGQEWKEICAKYPSLGASPGPSPGKPCTKAGDDAYYHPGVQDDGHGFLACCPNLETYHIPVAGNPDRISCRPKSTSNLNGMESLPVVSLV